MSNRSTFNVVIFSLLLLARHALAKSAKPNATIGGAAVNTSSCCTNAQDATTFAIVYGSPLVAFVNASMPFFGPGGAGTNQLIASEGLATPANTSVHHPNPDCLTPSVLVDLSSHDLVLTIPKIPDNRFWSFSFFDPYGSNFATTSSVYNSPPGKYIIRRAEDVRKPWGLELGNGSSKYQGYVHYPSTYGLMLVRILTLNDTSDIPVAERFQSQIQIEEIQRFPQSPYVSAAPALTDRMLDISNISFLGLQSLVLLSRMGYYNQPIVGADHYRVGAILAQAGINFFNRTYAIPPGVNLDAALSSAIQTAADDVAPKDRLSNGWAVQDPKIAGIFYNYYGERALAAHSGYLGDTSGTNINPGNKNYTGQSLPADRAYLLTFHGHVPVTPEFGGFWSVTAYLEDGNLVPNRINRYTLGNRDNLTYADGRPVYKQAPGNGTAIGTLAGSSVESDKPFQILLQGDSPPANWTSNWLPTPANGTFSVFKMRVYAPEEAARNGSYLYPTIQEIAAITA